MRSGGTSCNYEDVNAKKFNLIKRTLIMLTWQLTEINTLKMKYQMTKTITEIKLNIAY